MRAVEVTALGSFRLVADRPVPVPRAGEVRIRVRAAGICGTDVHICRGDPSVAKMVRPPIVLGHEFCGVIDALGPGANGFSGGEYVSAEMHEACGACAACLAGKRHACQRTRIHGVHLDGCFADYVVVPAGNVVRLPRSLPEKVGAILDPLGNAVHTAFKVDLRGRRVAVVGMGPIGAMTAEVAAFAGASRIFVADVKPRALERARAWVARRDLGERVEVLDVSAPVREEAIARVLAATEGGVDVAMEISGHPNGINDAIRMTRGGGDVVLLGIPRAETVPIEGFGERVIFRGLTLHAIIGREMFATWERMLDLLARGMEVEPFVTSEVPLERFPEALERFASGEEQKVVLRIGEGSGR
ncbi:MAG TPA: alcohol dehydrogenase catalytic domain-containing protein [Planctomycetota bacterium]|jgi:threonine 3-dehydrogenase|nr:alcohol dehydrogenase catalytic domain-containing protein [Planctomycetota bacterium]